jgi:2-polyprenyl-6-methoxyphenol hydroxylase-like FAD-dependent oxidoreductase
MAIDIPVLIIGAGPSGASLALHLGLLDIRTIVISRHSGTANTPRAHIFNQRAMEVLRDAGLEKRASAVASDATHMQHSEVSTAKSMAVCGPGGTIPARKETTKLPARA